MTPWCLSRPIDRRCRRLTQRGYLDPGSWPRRLSDAVSAAHPLSVHRAIASTARGVSGNAPTSRRGRTKSPERGPRGSYAPLTRLTASLRRTQCEPRLEGRSGCYKVRADRRRGRCTRWFSPVCSAPEGQNTREERPPDDSWSRQPFCPGVTSSSQHSQLSPGAPAIRDSLRAGHVGNGTRSQLTGTRSSLTDPSDSRGVQHGPASRGGAGGAVVQLFPPPPRARRGAGVSAPLVRVSPDLL
jgi:hypothetical protein